MIVIDTSALLAIAFNEPERAACEVALTSDLRRVMSAGTLAEALITSESKGIGTAVRSLIEAADPEIVPVTELSARLAFDAFRRYGKGRQPARLNYGDCFSYALDKELDCPLLCIGGDFSQTDLVSSL
ncbi:type II toxin-antitoxin system VapC family toxin [Devosia sp.]|uniref:type II toxin-antitoxin system VapC family toxin n=1 Tax=Devosia sp. TaxID=1871048 RepID=UPI0026325FC9|nr:type II toxin-antitoxin system VapC family toxin [Devosia sp.]